MLKKPSQPFSDFLLLSNGSVVRSWMLNKKNLRQSFSKLLYEYREPMQGKVVLQVLKMSDSELELEQYFEYWKRERKHG